MNLVRDLINAVAGVGAAGKVLSLNRSLETTHVVQARHVDFVENATNTSHVGTFKIPAGAVIVDIIVQNDILWTATSASLIVGDVGDPDGFYTAVDLKATDLAANESLRLGNAGGVEGAYSTGSLTHWKNLYAAAARVITATITVGTPATTVGRTSVTVVYVLPTAISPVVSGA